MQLQKLKEGPVIAQTTSSEMLRKALSEKQVKRNGKQHCKWIDLIFQCRSLVDEDRDELKCLEASNH